MPCRRLPDWRSRNTTALRQLGQFQESLEWSATLYCKEPAIFRRLPSKRAVAAYFKLRGYRLERRWPFLVSAGSGDLNLGFDDVLDFQHARSRRFTCLIVGAYDGIANDPLSRFIRAHRCQAILLEPQPEAFARLSSNYQGVPSCTLLNAAVDEVSGSRTLYYVPPGVPGLPEWVGQVASFSREHLAKHEARAPGISRHIQSREIATISFGDLLDKFQLDAIDILQIDAEGMDAQLLAWFPFERLKPGAIHYEVEHLSREEHRQTRRRLRELGYLVREADAPSDDMAVLL